MNCPACASEMTETTAGALKVDACRGGCGGIWFDPKELKRVDEPHESAGECLLDEDRNPAVVVDRTGRRNCPRCGDVVMMRHFYSARRAVEVDECPQCAGYWLDVGELARIRTEYGTEAERRKAAEEYFSDICDGELAEL